MKPFDLKKVRDFGEVISDTFLYIKLHYKTLGKVFAVYVFAPLLVGAILIGGGFGTIFGAAISGLDEEQIFSDLAMMYGFGFSMFGGMLVICIAFVMLYATVYQHISHVNRGGVPEKLGDFSSGMFSKALRLFAVTVILGTGVLLLYGAIIGLGVLAIEEFAILLIFLTLPFLVFVMVKLMVFPAAYFVEGGNPFRSLSRSWRLTGGFWWLTFGVYFVISLIFSVLSYLAMLPFGIIAMIVFFAVDMGSESSAVIMMGTFYALSFFFQILFAAAQTLAMGIHYFNLVERKEGAGLQDQIEKLGTGPAVV